MKPTKCHWSVGTRCPLVKDQSQPSLILKWSSSDVPPSLCRTQTQLAGGEKYQELSTKSMFEVSGDTAYHLHASPMAQVVPSSPLLLSTIFPNYLPVHAGACLGTSPSPKLSGFQLAWSQSEAKQRKRYLKAQRKLMEKFPQTAPTLL